MILDRGFGFQYFLQKLVDLKNHFVVRVRDLNTHVILVRSGDYLPINELVKRVTLKQPLLFKIKYKSTIDANLVICKKVTNGNIYTWALLTDLDDTEEVIDLYKQRMKIEEAFKDWKSTGFNIEKIQLHQWDVLPKLIWCVVIAHLILYLLGEVISKSTTNKDYFKKLIQKKSNLSYVQLAWKSWRYDPQKIPILIRSLNLISFPNLVTNIENLK